MEEDNSFHLRTNRIETLSDGIFAIAMTALVLSFDEIIFMPARSMREDLLFDKLVTLWPDFIYFVQSFMILGIFWYLHHRQLHFVKYANGNMLALNICGLMFITLIPFTTVLVGDYGQVFIASFLFELNLFLAGIVFYLHWVYVTRKMCLVDQCLSPRIVSYYKKVSLIVPAISVFAIGLSLVYPHWGRYGAFFYFSIPVILFFYKHK